MLRTVTVINHVCAACATALSISGLYRPEFHFLDVAGLATVAAVLGMTPGLLSGSDLLHRRGFCTGLPSVPGMAALCAGGLLLVCSGHHGNCGLRHRQGAGVGAHQPGPGLCSMVFLSVVVTYGDKDLPARAKAVKELQAGAADAMALREIEGLPLSLSTGLQECSAEYGVAQQFNEEQLLSVQAKMLRPIRTLCRSAQRAVRFLKFSFA